MDKPSYTLDFEKPLRELEKQIEHLHQQALENNLDVSAEIAAIERKLAETQRTIFIGRQGLRGDHPQQPGAVDAAEHRLAWPVEQPGGGHAVGQHEPHGGSQTGQDRRDHGMTRGREPRPEQIAAGRDGEETEHPFRSAEVGRHPGTVAGQPDHQRNDQHHEPARSDDQQRL